MPSRGEALPAYLGMGLPVGHPLRPTFSGTLAGKNDPNRQPRWPSIQTFVEARSYGQPACGALGQDAIWRELDRYFQKMLLSPDYSAKQVARETRKAADEIYARLRQGPFANSYNDPSLIRPADKDPLGLAP